jgi:hypothetical protein
MALVFVWLRLSAMKKLDWHRGSSYQSKDIAHVQKVIAQRVADKVVPPIMNVDSCHVLVMVVGFGMDDEGRVF